MNQPPHDRPAASTRVGLVPWQWLVDEDPEPPSDPTAADAEPSSTDTQENP